MTPHNLSKRIAYVQGRYLKPAPSFCPEDDPNCQRPELFAFEFVCGIVFLWLSVISIRSWHIRRSPQKNLPNNPIGRIYGYSEESELIAAVSLAFQFWDLVATPWIPEFSSGIMLGHHLAAALVSFVSLQYQYCHYYIGKICHMSALLFSCSWKTNMYVRCQSSMNYLLPYTCTYTYTSISISIPYSSLSMESCLFCTYGGQ